MSLIVEIKKRLGNFSLEVSLEMDGGISGLLGASGSGKSMTLKCIAGIIKPDSGRIILDDKLLFDSKRGINLPPQERHIGYLFQNYALFPHMTVRQNILCGMRGTMNSSMRNAISGTFCMKKDTIKKELKLQKIMKLTGLDGLESYRPIQLSGGQQQRVALARILIGEPKLLLLDEPFSAVDSYLREHLQIEMKNLLKNFTHNHNTLFVTHSRDEIYSLCRKTALLDFGRLITHQDTKQLWCNPESRIGAVLTGCKNIVDAKKVSNYEIEVSSWGIRLTTAEPVRNGLCAIGIRAHYFNPEITQNCFPIRIKDKIERPFEYNIQFQYENQNPESKNICWFLPKEKTRGTYIKKIGINPKDILLLYE